MKRKRGEIPNRKLTQGMVWLRLREAFYASCPTGHILRVENIVGRGIPDIYYRFGSSTTPGWSGWVEIKCGYDKLTPLQRAWHTRERGAGGRVTVLTIRQNAVILDYGEGPRNLGVVTWSDIVNKL